MFEREGERKREGGGGEKVKKNLVDDAYRLIDFVIHQLKKIDTRCK